MTRPLNKRAQLKIVFSYFSTKTYVVGTQKSHLNEMVLLSTQNMFILFDLILYVPVNNFSVMSGRVFLG